MYIIEELLSNWIGFDEVKVRILQNNVIEINIIISGVKQNNFYKLFVAFVDEYDKSISDPIAREIFKKSINDLDKSFVDLVSKREEEIKNLFTKVSVQTEVSYCGKFKAVYDRIKEILNEN